MDYIKNGILVQNIEEKNIFLQKYASSFLYHGVHEFSELPLAGIKNDREAAELFDKQIAKQLGEKAYQFTEFFTEKGLLKAYIGKCQALQIGLRLLFVESDGYTEEIWENAIPERRFLGYEVMEIPLDPWTLLDLANREQYERYRKALNENGLFKTEETAAAFRETYRRELEAGLVGDGPVDLFLCRIYEVALPDLLKALEP